MNDCFEKTVETHDPHATVLHLLGMDHRELTHRFSSQDTRLTDLHGHVIGAISA